jgi:hypothetical protein
MLHPIAAASPASPCLRRLALMTLVRTTTFEQLRTQVRALASLSLEIRVGRLDGSLIIDNLRNQALL